MFRRIFRMDQFRKEAQEAEQLASSQNEDPPKGCVFVQQGPLRRREGLKIPGTLLLVGNGTPGANRLLDNLIVLDNAGLSDIVGSILLHESDAITRERIQAMLPDIYRNRIVYAHAPYMTAGFRNRPPNEVEELIGQWGVYLSDGIKEVIQLHQKRNNILPGEITIFTSLGGHSYPGVYLTQELHKYVPDAQMVGVVNLPRKAYQRAYLLTLKFRYENAGIDGWIISDQMGSDYVRKDVTVAYIIAGITAASVRSDTSPRTNNIVTNVAGNSVGGMACYEFVYGEVVAHPFQPDPNTPLRYYVEIDAIHNELQRLIEITETGKGEVSLDVPTGEKDRITYDLALCAIDPEDMLNVRDYIERTRDIQDAQLTGKSRPHQHSKKDYECLYASWSKPIDPANPRCHLAVIRLRAVRDVDHTLTEIVKVPEERRYPSPDSSLSDELDNF